MLTFDLARAGVRPGALVLDLGCGAGRHAFACLRAGARVVALDASEAELGGVAAMCRAMEAEGEVPEPGAGAMVAADGRQLPFADGSFDCVLASEVLEHVVDDRRAMAELARVLRPGGVVAVSVPRFGPEAVNWALSAAYHGAEGGHVRIYRLGQLLARLSGAGLRPTGRHFAHGLHSPYWWLRCLVGVDREDQVLVAAYHRLLVWEIERAPRLTRWLASVLDPVIGKSLVLYLGHESPPPPGHAGAAVAPVPAPGPRPPRPPRSAGTR